jgi:hypothetical protein
MQRLIAVLLAVFFLGLAGLMASVTLFVRDPIPVVSARVPLIAATDPEAGAPLRARVIVDGAFRFEVIGEGLRAPAPTALLRRGQGGAGDIPVALEPLGGGAFRGRGQFTAPGRWALVLDDGGTATEFPFILQE